MQSFCRLIQPVSELPCHQGGWRADSWRSSPYLWGAAMATYASPVPIDRVEFALELLNRSVVVDQMLRDSEVAGLGLDERSITDLLLIAIKNRFHADIEIVTYSSQQEGATSGADWRWEWLFEGQLAWFAMLVQAKKLKAIPGGGLRIRLRLPIDWASAANRPTA